MLGTAFLNGRNMCILKREVFQNKVNIISRFENMA
jgi:hypothetical protein